MTEAAEVVAEDRVLDEDVVDVVVVQREVRGLEPEGLQADQGCDFKVLRADKISGILNECRVMIVAR